MSWLFLVMAILNMAMSIWLAADGYYWFAALFGIAAVAWMGACYWAQRRAGK